MQNDLYAGIELGGTESVCAVGFKTGEIVQILKVATTDAAETMQQVIHFFEQYKPQLKAVGIGSFGPLDLNPQSANYGTMTTVPKPGWTGTAVLKIIQEALSIPAYITTDVTVAAIAEQRLGIAKDCPSVIYVTVGTGIGGAFIVDGQPLHGMMSHAEMGHLMIPKQPSDAFPGSCSYHGACLEGLASGVAIERRWQMSAKELSDEHAAWDLEATYLALGLANIILTVAPKRIVIGGGVMQRKDMLPRIRQNTARLLGDYLALTELSDELEHYLVFPALGDEAGVVGALLLASAPPTTV